MKETWKRVRPVVFVAWIVAAVRLVLEFTMKPGVGDPGWYVSVYYAIGLALVVVGLRSLWGSIGIKSLLASTALIAVLCFFVPNTITYTTGQFQGWTHGRFRPPAPGKEGWGKDPDARAAPLADSTSGKLGAGLMLGGATTLGGLIWTTAFGLVFIYVPAVIRRRKSAAS